MYIWERARVFSQTPVGGNATSAVLIFMKYSKNIIFSIFLTAGSVFSAKADTTDNYQLYIRGKLVQTESSFLLTSNTFNYLIIEKANSNDTISLNFNHCTNSGSNRHIKLVTFTQRIAYEWSFPNKEIKNMMNLPIEQIWYNKQINNHPLRRWIESIGQSPLYVSDGGENKSKFRVWLSSFLSSPS